MKIILPAILLFISSIVCAQKTYNVVGILPYFTDPKMPSINHVTNAQMTVTVTDTTFTTTYKNKTASYKIIKKVDDNYFKITDGLKEYIIRIANESPIYKRFTGSITQEGDKGTFIMFYK